jgi:hypothetical protein
MADVLDDDVRRGICDPSLGLARDLRRTIDQIERSARL